MPTGYTASTPTTRSISLTPGEDRTDVDFGAFTTGVLGDRLWHDLDGDGIEDPGEPGLVGVDVRLTGAGAPVIVTTDANGDYSFTGLDPGTYTVDVVGSTLPVGTNSGVALVATTADSLVRTVVSAATDRTLDFGFATTARIGDTVFTDTNGNGVQDGTESGSSGVTLELRDDTDSVVATAVTGPGGNYVFNAVNPGRYTVTAVPTSLPAGVIATNGPIDVTVVSDQSLSTADLGFVAPGELHGLVFTDVDGEGTSVGDPGLGSVDLDLIDDSGSVVATTTSAADGRYSFIDVVPGTYTVRPVVTPGWILTTVDVGPDATDSDIDISGSTSPILVASGGRIDDLGVGLYQPVRIGDTVFVDLDGNGVHDPDEPGLPGVRVDLRDASALVIATVITDLDGSYIFDGLAPGSYTVDVTVPSGYGLTTANDPAAVPLVSASSDLSVDFGLVGLDQLSGRVIFDVDADGVNDPEDLPISTAIVDVIWHGPDGAVGTADDLLFSVPTATDGSYSATGLPPGIYTVAVRSAGLPSGVSINTFDPDATLDRSTVITLGGATAPSSLDFGVTGSGAIGDIVWLDSNGDGLPAAGEPLMGGIGVIARWFGPDGAAETADDLVFSTVTAPDGSYRFDHLPSGRYLLSIDTATVPIELSVPLSATVVLAPGATDLTADLPLTDKPAPTAVDDVRTTPVNTAIQIDVDGNDTTAPATLLTIRGITQPSNGTVTINANGTVTYTPNHDYVGTDRFTYTVCSMSAGLTVSANALVVPANCATATVTVTVPPNQPPVLASTNNFVLAVGQRPGPLVLPDPELHDATVTVTSGSVPPGITLNPDGSFSGTATTPGDYTAEIRICDNGSPMACSIATLNFTVTAVVDSVPGTLAFTGADSRYLIGIGLLLLAIGLVMLIDDRRRNPHNYNQVERSD